MLSAYYLKQNIYIDHRTRIVLFMAPDIKTIFDRLDEIKRLNVNHIQISKVRRTLLIHEITFG